MQCGKLALELNNSDFRGGIVNNNNVNTSIKDIYFVNASTAEH